MDDVWVKVKDEYIKRKSKGDKFTLTSFAKEFDVKCATLRSRKNREAWDDFIVGNDIEKNHNKKDKNNATKDKKKSVATKINSVATKPKNVATKSKKSVASKNKAIPMDLAKSNATKSKTVATKNTKNKESVASKKQVNSTTTKSVATKMKSVATKFNSVATPFNGKNIEDLTKENEDEKTAELTEKQQFFCLHYIKNFNATMAAIKAGYSKETAHVMGSRLLRKVKVKNEIKRLKEEMTNDIFLDAKDVLNKYIKIAFSDITDYVSFGQREELVIGKFGMVLDENEEPLTKIVNYVDFNSSSYVDGSIITEAKQGKDGISIKFADKMKALEKLEKYFDLIPDNFKRKIEEEKLKIQKDKLEIEKTKFYGDDEEIVDDGFIEALKQEANNVWDDYEDENKEDDEDG